MLQMPDLKSRLFAPSLFAQSGLFAKIGPPIDESSIQGPRQGKHYTQFVLLSRPAQSQSQILSLRGPMGVFWIVDDESSAEKSLQRLKDYKSILSTILTLPFGLEITSMRAFKIQKLHNNNNLYNKTEYFKWNLKNQK